MYIYFLKTANNTLFHSLFTPIFYKGGQIQGRQKEQIRQKALTLQSK